MSYSGKYGILFEISNILNFYDYPVVIITKISDGFIVWNFPFDSVKVLFPSFSEVDRVVDEGVQWKIRVWERCMRPKVPTKSTGLHTAFYFVFTHGVIKLNKDRVTFFYVLIG